MNAGPKLRSPHYRGSASIVLGLILILGLAVFSVSFAQFEGEIDPGVDPSTGFGYCQGLVPCGCTGGTPCQPCHIFALIQNILNFLWWYISIPIATLMFAYAGFLLMLPSLGSGSPPMLAKGKKILKNTIIGILIIFFAWLIVDTIIKVLAGQPLASGDPALIPKRLGFSPGNLGPWNEIECSSTGSSPFAPPVGGGPGGPPPNEGIFTWVENDPAAFDPGDFTGSIDGTVNGFVFNDGIQTNTPEMAAIISEPGEGSSIDPFFMSDLPADQFTPTIDVPTDPFPFVPQPSVKVIDKLVPYKEHIIQAANKWGVDPARIQGVIMAESSGNPNAVNPEKDNKQSTGLMQIRADTVRSIIPELKNSSDSEINNKLKDPAFNIAVGTQHYASLLQKYGDSTLASAAYNGGPVANNPSINCPGLRRWQCKWDDDAHTVPNTGYNATRKYVVNIQDYENRAK